MLSFLTIIQELLASSSSSSRSIYLSFDNVFLEGSHTQRSVLLTKYHSGDQVKKAEMGRTCGAYGGEEICIQGFGEET
jgi:hypothetical protein